MRNQVSASSVNVEVDAKPQADMAAVMTDIRAQYETIAEKNRRDMESWYKAKVMHALGLMFSSSCTEIGTEE